MGFPVLALIDPLYKLIDKIIPDKEAAAKAKLELTKEENQSYLAELQAVSQVDVAQAAINLEEAKSESFWKSGGRPFIIWVCGFAFAYKYVIQPFLIFTLVASGSEFDYTNLPNIDYVEMIPVLLGMLGLGYQRTLDKRIG